MMRRIVCLMLTFAVVCSCLAQNMFVPNANLNFNLKTKETNNDKSNTSVNISRSSTGDVSKISQMSVDLNKSTDIVVILNKSGEQIGEYYSIEDAVEAWNKPSLEVGNQISPIQYDIVIKNGTYSIADIVIEQFVGRTLNISSNTYTGVSKNKNNNVVFQYNKTGKVHNTSFRFMFMIDGKNKYNTGAITFSGFEFDFSNVVDENYYYAIGFMGDLPSTNYRYVNDITISNCIFTGHDTYEIWGVGTYTNDSSPSAITIDNCYGVSLAGLYNGYIANNAGFAFKILNCTVEDSNNLINIIGGQGESVVKDTTVEFNSNFAIRYNGGDMLVENSELRSIKTDDHEMLGAIVVRGASGNLTVKNTNFYKKVENFYDVFNSTPTTTTTPIVSTNIIAVEAINKTNYAEPSTITTINNGHGYTFTSPVTNSKQNKLIPFQKSISVNPTMKKQLG